MYTRPIEPRPRLDRRARSRTNALVHDANLAAFKAGYHFGETAELFDHPFEVAPGAAAAGSVPQHQRQRRAGLRADRGRPAGQAADPLRVVPDHAGLGHPARAVEAQELRRAHDAGRGRDRRHRRRHRRRVRRSARRHRDERPRRGPQGRGARPRDEHRAAADARRRAARWPVDRACRPRPSRPTCCSRCTAATARRRCRSSPRSRRATASTPRSRACGWRVKYRTPVIVLTDGYMANGSEPWRFPDVDELPDISVPFAEEPEPRAVRRHLGLLAVPA